MQTNDIETMLDKVSEQSHLERLSARMNEGLHAWHVRRQRTVAAAAVLALLLLPAAYAALLPAPHESHIACNMRGGDDDVMRCAQQIFTIR